MHRFNFTAFASLSLAVMAGGCESRNKIDIPANPAPRPSGPLLAPQAHRPALINPEDGKEMVLPAEPSD